MANIWLDKERQIIVERESLLESHSLASDSSSPKRRPLSIEHKKKLAESLKKWQAKRRGTTWQV
jgi:hypothetical protein